jgi:hypothetical protein
MADMRVHDDGDNMSRNYVWIVVLAVAVIVLLALLFFWRGGYFGGPQIINVTPTSPGTQITPGALGAPGTPGGGGGGGVPGSTTTT